MKRHIQYNWWKYATAIIASVVLWCAVFNSLAMPEENEKLHILFVGQGLEREKLEQAVSEMLPSVTEQSVRQVKVQQVRLHGREAFRRIYLPVRHHYHQRKLFSRKYGTVDSVKGDD